MKAPPQSPIRRSGVSGGTPRTSVTTTRYDAPVCSRRRSTSSPTWLSIGPGTGCCASKRRKPQVSARTLRRLARRPGLFAGDLIRCVSNRGAALPGHRAVGLRGTTYAYLVKTGTAASASHSALAWRDAFSQLNTELLPTFMREWIYYLYRLPPATAALQASDTTRLQLKRVSAPSPWPSGEAPSDGQRMTLKVAERAADVVRHG